MQSTNDKIMATIAAMDKLEATIAKETGAAVNVRACLQEFSRATPDSIRLTNIFFRVERGQTIGTLSGYAFDGPSGAGGSAEVVSPAVVGRTVRRCPATPALRPHAAVVSPLAGT